jgi:ribosome-binding factor A
MPNAAASRRQKRVNSVLLDALSLLLIQELQEVTPDLVTVTRVETAADLQSARVRISLYGSGDKDAAMAYLRKRTGALRRILATRVDLKYNPMLFFELDPAPAFAERLDALIAGSKSHDDDTD